MLFIHLSLMCCGGSLQAAEIVQEPRLFQVAFDGEMLEFEYVVGSNPTKHRFDLGFEVEQELFQDGSLRFFYAKTVRVKIFDRVDEEYAGGKAAFPIRGKINLQEMIRMKLLEIGLRQGSPAVILPPITIPRLTPR